MKKLLYILCVGLLMTTTSCKDSLDKNPLDTPSEATFWKEKGHFDMALNSMYVWLGDWDARYQGFTAYAFDNITDNSACPHDEGTYGYSIRICNGDVTPTTGGYLSDVYKYSYTVIARANIFLKKLSEYKGADITADQRKLYEAEAKFFRGYAYSWLYQCYEEVPVVTEPVDMETQYQAKKTGAEVYKQVLTDYQAAIDGLPNKTYAAAGGHITKNVAKAFKAKVIMFHAFGNNPETANINKTDMADAVALLESVTGYSLAPFFEDNFLTTEQESSPEIMFSAKYLAPDVTTQTDLYNGAWGATAILSNAADEFELADGRPWKGSAEQAAIDETKLRSSDIEKVARPERAKMFVNRDPRLAMTVAHSGRVEFDDVMYYDAGEKVMAGFLLKKYLQPSDEKPSYSTVSEQDMVIMRYAHVLLLLAEAENEVNGPTAKAYDAINAVRDRVDMPDVPTGLSQDEFRKAVRHELRVELMGEGHRYMDLKRWKLLTNNLVTNFKEPVYEGYNIVYKNQFYNWPLPQGEIDKAKGVLVQNPNYK